MSTQAQELASPAESEAGDADVRLVAVRKTFGDVVAVDSIDLEIPRGEFFTMLGPSGSGKTTTLRLIAGFDHPDSGKILLGGVDVANKPPYERDVNTVFQDYALFPHMTVAQNVEYGLKVKRVPKDDRRSRVEEALQTVLDHRDQHGLLPSTPVNRPHDQARRDIRRLCRGPPQEHR